MLRSYQQEALEAVSNIRSKHSHGGARSLIVLPTGTGKAVVEANIPEALGMKRNEQMIALVHKDELVWQMSEKLQKYNPRLIVDVEKAQYRSNPNANIIVASVPSIGRNKLNKETGQYEWCKRIQKFDPDRFMFVAPDETHHCVGQTWQSVFAYFGVLKRIPEYNIREKVLCGFTATPERGDNIGMELFYDDIAYSKEILEMTRDGWLVDICAWRVETQVDISDVRTNAGDFAVGELERRINTPERNNAIVKAYKEHGEGFQFFCYAVDVQHATDVAKAFSDAGISASCVHGKMKDEDRREAFARFRSGEIRGLCSAGILNEGVDIPQVVVGIMARPTKSSLLYRQSIGRVLRPFPSPEDLTAMRMRGEEPHWIKPYAIVLDVCDVAGRHSLHSVPTLYGLRPDWDMKGKKASVVVDEVEKAVTAAAKKGVTVDPNAKTNIEDLKILAEKIDLFAKPQISHEVQQNSKLAWLGNSRTGFTLCLPEKLIFRVTENTLGGWDLSKSINGVRTSLGTFSRLAEALSKGDHAVPANERVLVSQDAKWKQRPPTEKQTLLMWRSGHHLKDGFPSYEQFHSAVVLKYNQGDVSTLITQHLQGMRK